MKDYDLENRRLVLSAVAIGIVVIYVIRLFALQIASDDYRKSADSNAFLKKIEFPSRGRSRTGKAGCWSITSRPTISWSSPTRWRDILTRLSSAGL